MIFAITAVVTLVLIGGTYIFARSQGRFDVIDTVWGLGFVVIALVSARSVLPTLLTCVWGLRLAVHIEVRRRGSGEDRRYADINPVRAYATQAIALWVISLPVQVAGFGSPPLWLVCAGVVVWLVGFVFEAVGDYQLQRFRGDPANQGKVLDTGLWRYTRHPNYFGDACVWWGLYLLACHSWLAAATIVSPIVVTVLLAKGTGKPLLEKNLVRNRPDYAAYVSRTSGFVPLPPKR
ncbi:DUF1295 domain-containing protein [Amycolatopsis sp.]|uniref:DUF1295 domain-containing protein n=1 Tax=Amycolatopsis sp. TaxID=37632 RepID=UPI002CD53A9B|nr:DUF1295 domain-containing protein [Amycolatopsis sp.]HVV13901.1 DUF1295 domain-containing protein [Amycolatopsis sp.]